MKQKPEGLEANLKPFPGKNKRSLGCAPLFDNGLGLADSLFSSGTFFEI